MATADDAMNPRRYVSESDKMTDRELLTDTRRMVGNLRTSLFGTGLDDTEIIDKSGGIIARMDKRIETLEQWFKKMAISMVFMCLMMVLNGGITNAKTIWEFVQKVFVLSN